MFKGTSTPSSDPLIQTFGLGAPEWNAATKTFETVHGKSLIVDIDEGHAALSSPWNVNFHIEDEVCMSGWLELCLLGKQLPSVYLVEISLDIPGQERDSIP